MVYGVRSPTCSWRCFQNKVVSVALCLNSACCIIRMCLDARTFFVRCHFGALWQSIGPYNPKLSHSWFFVSTKLLPPATHQSLINMCVIRMHSYSCSCQPFTVVEECQTKWRNPDQQCPPGPITTRVSIHGPCPQCRGGASRANTASQNRTSLSNSGGATGTATAAQTSTPGPRKRRSGWPRHVRIY